MKYATFTYYLGLNGYFQTPDDQVEALPVLEPLYEPEPVIFSYETPAWYVLGVLILILLIFGLWTWHRGYRSRKYRRVALKTLEGLQFTTADSAVLSTIQITLKQVAIATYGRPKVAALFGAEWLQFLEHTGKQTVFTTFKLLLGTGTDGSLEHELSEIKALRDTAKKWIKTHG